ncbi:hypothetical protein FGRMN_4362 [Fusarium graminum]|nr:hypothetical protein FGRMN_4362 [Fusarium graminum]
MKLLITLALLCSQVSFTLAAPVAEEGAVESDRPRDPIEAPSEEDIIGDVPALNGETVPREGKSVKISFGDGELNFGGVFPADMLEILREKCPDGGCKPGFEYEVESFYAEGGNGGNRKVKMVVQGSFNEPGLAGDINQLVDAGKAALEGLIDNGVATSHVEKYIVDPCPAWQTHGCLGSSISESTQWKSTNYISVRINAPDDSLISFMTVAFYAEDPNAGFCNLITAAGVTAATLAPGMALAANGIVVGSILCGHYI